MTNAYELRNRFFLEDYNTAISREDFEAFFTKTKEKVTFTFNGWDGKSYDGESRRASVYFEQNYIPKRDLLPRIPLGVDPAALWEEIINRRKARSTQLPLLGPRGRPFWYVTTEKMISASETIVEELMESTPQGFAAPAISPLEEVFYTSYVEGSNMEMEEAMAFLQGGMEPGDIHEQMIVNNRSALSFAGSNLYRPVDAEYIKMLAGILTLNMEGGGKEYRTTDWVDIPSMMGEPYELPAALGVPDCVREITEFLSDPVVHPLIKAAIAHAWALVVRPFPVGNERLARLLSTIILIRAGYTFFGEVSLSFLIARNGYPYYNAAANILRSENGGDLTYFLEYYLTLLAEAVQERRRHKDMAGIEAEMDLAQVPIQQPQIATQKDAGPEDDTEDDPTWPSGPGGVPSDLGGGTDPVGDSLAAEGFTVMEAGEEDSAWNDDASWAGEAKARSALEEIVGERRNGSGSKQLAEMLLRCLDMKAYVFSSKDLMGMMGYSGDRFDNLTGRMREKGILEKIGRADGYAVYTFTADGLTGSDYSFGMASALDIMKKSNSSKDRRIGDIIRACLPQGSVTIREYEKNGEESKWNDDMKLAEQLGFVRRIAKDRCVILRDVKPCFGLLDSSQRRRARIMYESFGEDTFSLEMVVAVLDYSSSTASAYLHQFTLLKILDCRKEDVNMYQFRVNPKEHPEVFEDVA